MQKLHLQIGMPSKLSPTLILRKGSVGNIAEATFIGARAKNFVGTIDYPISKTRNGIIDKDEFLS